MNRNGFDERQLAARNKAAVSTMVLLVILFFINGYLVDYWRMWGTGLE